MNLIQLNQKKIIIEDEVIEEVKPKRHNRNPDAYKVHKNKV